MLTPKTLLQPRYSLSVFTTTLLIALTTESSLAFSITTPTEYSPVEIYNTYSNNSSYVGVVTLYPEITSITRGGTTEFLQTLNQAFPSWTFNPAPTDLVGSFQVERYTAEYIPETEEFAPGVGARLRLQYDYGNGDPKPEDSALHWIQRVFTNHDIRNDITGYEGHGIYADIIDNKSSTTDPYYDTAYLNSFDERTFRDFPKRHADQNHNWLAELYLVKETGLRQVTIYNGIQWGWNNTAQPVPEPLTIFASGVCLGFGALLKKTVKGTGQNKTKTLQKVKD